MDEVYKPTTVRFTQEVYEALHEIAAEHGLSVGSVARLAITDRLSRYLGVVKYMDYDQGQQISLQIAGLADTMSQIRNELHRIGVNYNQEIKLRQIEKKYAGRTGIDALTYKMNEEKAVKAECAALDMDQLENLIQRYEDASAKVGEALCRMQG